MTTLAERKALASVEMWKVVEWLDSESEKIYAELDKKGLGRGLDGNREAFAEMHKEFARRMMAIGEKYNLPREQKKD